MASTATFDDQTGTASPVTYALPIDASAFLTATIRTAPGRLRSKTPLSVLGTLLQWRLDISVETVAVNSSISSVNIIFDRDINVATFVPANILRAVGPISTTPGRSPSRRSRHAGTVVVGGVNQPGNLARTFTVGFPTQVLSGTYSFVFGQDTTNPNKNTNYVADALGNLLDNNFNAGLNVLKDEPDRFSN